MNILALIVVVCAAGLIIWLQQRLIDKLQTEKSGLLDRWLVSKGLAPQGVDLKAVHERREEKKEEARKVSLPRADVLTSARHKLIAEEQERLHLN